jgi:hypothetical protein
LEHLDGFGGQRQQALLISFAEDPDVRIGQLEIFESEIEGLTGAQAVQQHQGDQGEIPRGTKADPELGDLIGGERHNDALWLLEPKPGGNHALWAAVTERGSCALGALEVVRPCRQRMSGMKTIQRVEHGQAMVDGLGSGFWLFVELIAVILEQCGFIHLEQSP